ncbi:DUF389 domain-containing protein [Actinoplanes aureus]|uniref:DUF389 domain-containing protein n=1 Tax=Actinoplanes aureus TaxID=2792083 RepID=A0A931G0I1_9ACTN|nr:DUF389 domain-containing protein [Actinoplanes aureus]MBG0564091.1 DUF389 domain-containing protein [Actinoplanes aureus]
MAGVTEADLDRMVGRLFLDTRRQRSAFWVLLVLAAIIATAGVVADSDATVIGAMIVAPLMTPILGTGFGLVLADRRRILASALLVVSGAVLVVLIGFGLGLLVAGPVVADTNSQVAGRVHPELIDLVAALATGAVGAFALVRSDVSDTLPGVAIAISLVPPLAVVGLTLESGAPRQSAGALLLFATNVAAIIATATAVLIGYRVRYAAIRAGRPVGRLRPLTLAVVGLVVVLVAIPLTLSSAQVFRDQAIVSAAQPVAERWARSRSWDVVNVTVQQGVLRVTAAGPPPPADDTSLRQALDDAGLADVPVRLSLVYGEARDLP